MTDDARTLAQSAEDLRWPEDKTVAELHEWTFERKLVRPSDPNVACKQEGCPGGSDIHPYWTQDHKPVIFPDQWAEGDNPMDGLIEAPADLDLSEFVEMGQHYPT